jgi:hypothetical protein
MVPHLDTVCTIHDLERQHRLAEASRVHGLLATSQTPHSGARLSAGVRTPAMVLRRLTGVISLHPTVATGHSS